MRPEVGDGNGKGHCQLSRGKPGVTMGLAVATELNRGRNKGGNYSGLVTEVSSGRKPPALFAIDI